MINLPNFLIRPDDYEIFSKNESSDTYSSYKAKEKFPYNWHHKYTYEHLIRFGFLSFFGTYEQLLTDLADRVSYSDPKAEAQKTSAEIAELKAVNESLQKQVAELTSLAQAAKEDIKKAESEKDEEMKMMKDECEVKVEMSINKWKSLSSLEERLDRIEKLLFEEFNKECVHEFETVGGVNTNYRHYYSGSHSYIKCIKCGFRKQT